MIQEAVVAPSAPTMKDDGDRKPEYPKPDTNQMIPFQPRHLARKNQNELFKCPLWFYSAPMKQIITNTKLTLF